MCIKTFPNLILEIYLWNWKCSYPISSLQWFLFYFQFFLTKIQLFSGKIFLDDYFGKWCKVLACLGSILLQWFSLYASGFLHQGAHFQRIPQVLRIAAHNYFVAGISPSGCCCGTQMSTWFKTCNTHYINQGWRERINQSISFYNFRKLRRRSRCEGSSDPPRESTFQVESQH